MYDLPVEVHVRATVSEGLQEVDWSSATLQHEEVTRCHRSLLTTLADQVEVRSALKKRTIKGLKRQICTRVNMLTDLA